MLAPLEAQVRERLAGFVFGADHTSIAERGARLAASARRDDRRCGVVYGRAYCGGAYRGTGFVAEFSRRRRRL